MTSSAHNLTQRFPKRRAFITGAASGLGLACAESLAREGWQLFLTDVDAGRLDLVTQSFRRDGAQVMIRHMARGPGGLIINIASVAGFCAGPQMSAYNASKAAVIALSETLMQEYGAYGVRTMVVMPAFFRTSIIDNGRGPARVLDAARKLIDKSNLEAPEVAEAILMAASRGRTHLVYPPKYRGLWWLKRFMPQRWHQIFPRLTRR